MARLWNWQKGQWVSVEMRNQERLSSCKWSQVDSPETSQKIATDTSDTVFDNMATNNKWQICPLVFVSAGHISKLQTREHMFLQCKVNCRWSSCPSGEDVESCSGSFHNWGCTIFYQSLITGCQFFQNKMEFPKRCADTCQAYSLIKFLTVWKSFMYLTFVLLQYIILPSMSPSCIKYHSSFFFKYSEKLQITLSFFEFT